MAFPVIALPTAMHRLAGVVILLALSTAAPAASPLVTPAELGALRGSSDVRVVDIRDATSYGDAHIPGALSAPYGSWRGPAANPGELPALPALAKRVQSLGIGPGSHVIVVSAGDDVTDFGAAARVYWTLKLVGLRELSVLNGGMAAWQAAGLPVDRVPASVAPSTFVPRVDTSLLATREQLAGAVGAGRTRLVDARPAAYFNGETRHQAAKLPGTIRGAVNVEHATWFVPGTTTFVSPREAHAIAAAKAIDSARETISFCNTGHWAATNWFALSEVLGQQDVRLYAGSMVDWTQAPERLPMDNVPNRFEQLVIDWKLWVDRTFD